eukprot:561365-Prymnesium_polylepis.1
MCPRRRHHDPRRAQSRSRLLRRVAGHLIPCPGWLRAIEPLAAASPAAACPTHGGWAAMPRLWPGCGCRVSRGPWTRRHPQAHAT